jgi:glycosyltransferase involved in cell wall biosynthesis
MTGAMGDVTDHDAEPARALPDHEADIADLERNLTAVMARAIHKIEMAEREAAAAASRARTAEARLAAERAMLNARLAATEGRLRMVTASTMWRATRPLRWAGGHMPAGLRRTLRRAALLLWWTVTLQLFARVRTYRAARSHAAAGPSPGLQAVGGAAPSPGGADATVLAPPSAAESAAPAPPDASPPAPLPKTGRPRAFIIDSRWPRPDQDSGSIDAVTQMRALARLGYEIVFASDIEYDAAIGYRLQLELEGVICLSAALSPSIAEFLERDGASIDLCILSRVSCGGRYLEAARRYAPQARIVFNTVDLHHLREAREARLLGDAALLRQADLTRARELHIAGDADATIVVSAAERLVLAETVPRAMIVEMPLARRLRPAAHIPGFAARSGVGFVGGFEHPPNIDAVRFLLAEIWPLVLRRLPEATLTLVGKGLPETLLASAPAGVTYLGHLPTLDPWLDAIRLTVAPLRYGAGAKGKVASSLAAGVPCVSTTIGAEGMGLEDGVHLAVADTPEAFAQRICAVHEDATLWRLLSEGGYEKARRHFSVAAGQERWAALLARLNGSA